VDHEFGTEPFLFQSRSNTVTSAVKSMLETLMKWFSRTLLVSTVVSAGLVSQGIAQTDPRTSRSVSTPNRTPDGHPDFQGVWSNNTVTPFLRPKAAAGKPVLTDNELSVLKERAVRLFSGEGDTAPGDELFEALLANPNVYITPRRGGDYNQFWAAEQLVFEHRTSQLIDPPDGLLPALSAEGERKQAARAEDRRLHPADGPEDLLPITRCISHGIIKMGFVQSRNNSYYRIVQTPGAVLLYTEMMGEARIIPLDGRPHAPASMRRWLGDSRGRWDGNALVIDTVNLHPGATFSPAGRMTFSAEHFHIIERLTLLDADTVQYQATVEDATTWGKPWTAVTTWKRSQNPIFEYACHEGNYAMEGILRGARADEGVAADAAKKPKQ
jgi:hypothetical protein